MQLAKGLCDPSLRPHNEHALRAWGYRVGLRARDSIVLCSKLSDFAGSAAERSCAVLHFFGADQPSHAFHVEPCRWLRMTEAQATKSLARFLHQGGGARIRAFLLALAPDFAWPEKLSSSIAQAEVRAGSGRIDLLLTGESQNQVWGAVVEAKFDHNLKGNPLPDYARAGRANGLLYPSAPDAPSTAVLAVLGTSNCRTTRQRLNRNKNWRFAHWWSVLRRLERQLAGMPDDDQFRHFRRTLWDRIR